MKTNGFSYKTKHYKKIGQKDIINASKIIICGTSLKDNEFLKNTKEFSWIKNYEKPLLGICGGAHIIGLTLGYKLKKGEEIGLKPFEIKKEFLGIKPGRKINVYHLHQFKVLPEVFKKDNLYATLFHPEVRNKNIIVEFCRL